MPKKPDDCIDLPEWTDEENEWIVAVLALPHIKPKRAASLFVAQFEHFQEMPVDTEAHPDIEGPYYTIDKVVQAVVNKFYTYRANKETANYKAIQAQKEIYSEAFGNLSGVLPVFNVLEFALLLQEMYVGVKEYDKNKINLLKEALALGDSFYTPKAVNQDSEDSDTPVPGWHIPKAPTREEHERKKAKEKTDSGNS